MKHDAIQLVLQFIIGIHLSVLLALQWLTA